MFDSIHDDYLDYYLMDIRLRHLLIRVSRPIWLRLFHLFQQISQGRVWEAVGSLSHSFFLLLLDKKSPDCVGKSWIRREKFYRQTPGDWNWRNFLMTHAGMAFSSHCFFSPRKEKRFPINTAKRPCSLLLFLCPLHGNGSQKICIRVIYTINFLWLCLNLVG